MYVLIFERVRIVLNNIFHSGRVRRVICLFVLFALRSTVSLRWPMPRQLWEFVLLLNQNIWKSTAERPKITTRISFGGFSVHFFARPNPRVLTTSCKHVSRMWSRCRSLFCFFLHSIRVDTHSNTSFRDVMRRVQSFGFSSSADWARVTFDRHSTTFAMLPNPNAAENYIALVLTVWDWGYSGASHTHYTRTSNIEAEIGREKAQSHFTFDVIPSRLDMTPRCSLTAATESLPTGAHFSTHIRFVRRIDFFIFCLCSAFAGTKRISNNSV